jgi:hypothetical protein
MLQYTAMDYRKIGRLIRCRMIRWICHKSSWSDSDVTIILEFSTRVEETSDFNWYHYSLGPAELPTWQELQKAKRVTWFAQFRNVTKECNESVCEAPSHLSIHRWCPVLEESGFIMKKPYGGRQRNAQDGDQDFQAMQASPRTSFKETACQCIVRRFSALSSVCRFCSCRIIHDVWKSQFWYVGTRRQVTVQ